LTSEGKNHFGERGDFLPFDFPFCIFFSRFGKLFPELEKKRRVRRTPNPLLAFEKNLYPHTRPITLTGVM
jgi:hypothetical protein